jgi:hypothetical protein
VSGLVTPTCSPPGTRPRCSRPPGTPGQLQGVLDGNQLQPADTRQDRASARRVAVDRQASRGDDDGDERAELADVAGESLDGVGWCLLAGGARAAAAQAATVRSALPRVAAEALTDLSPSRRPVW